MSLKLSTQASSSFSVHASLVYTDLVQTQLCRGSSLEGDDLIYILHLEPFYYENCGALP